MTGFRFELVTEQVEDRKVWAAEVRDPRGDVVHQTSWRWHVTDAIHDGQWAVAQAPSKLAYDEARAEVAAQYAHAS